MVAFCHMARERILLIEDEPDIAEVLQYNLEKEGFDVELAHRGDSGLESLRRQAPDLILLDLMLPGIDGIEACRRIRAFSDAYIVMLTAKAEESDKIVGLSTGADDYVTKPFSPGELVARVRAMLRRPRAAAAPAAPRSFGELEIDPRAREVHLAGRLVDLTRREFDVLDTLAAEPGVAFSRDRLLEHVWGPGWFGDDHVVDVHIANLRRKLADDPAAPRYIRTVRGIGYRMGSG